MIKLEICFAAGLAALMMAGCGHKADTAPAPRPVLVEHPQPLAGESGEVFPGTVRARVEADLAFRVPGKIVSRPADAGAVVKPGQVLASLDPQDARLNTEAAQANVAAADADVNLAEAQLARQKEMIDKGFASKASWDIQENQAKLARARAEQARSQFAVVKNQAMYSNLVSDRPGVITSVLAEAGQVVAAGQPVFRFAADGEREVVIHVPEGRLDAVQKADKLSVTLWAQSGKFYPARVREINQQADRATRTHEVRVSLLEADDAVRLGMTATVVVGERIEARSFIVPLSALGGSKQQPAVWVVDADGKAHPVPVQVLRYLETGVIVSGALDPAMNMVSAGIHLMTDGLAVTTLTRQRGS